MRSSSVQVFKIDITDEGAVSICGVDTARRWMKANEDDQDHRN